MHNNFKRIIPVVVVILILVIYGFYYASQNSLRENQIYSGTIEAEEIHLGVLSGGQVDQVFVEEGDAVKENELLASIKGPAGNIRSPIDGLVLLRAIDPGEIVPAGATVFTVGNLSELTITVYVPEDKYGLVNLGNEYTVSVDSYPGRTFSGWVTRIADQAEFTPRNVLTVEGRKNTVYAVKLKIPNPDLALKPGMPADVLMDLGQ